MTLIEKVPEAAEFVTRVLTNPELYFLFDGEPFAQFGAGVFAGSKPDLRNDRITPDALRGMVSRLRQHPVWMHANHNPLVHPIGRILTAEVFHEPDSDTHFLAGVYGYFDPQKLPRVQPTLPHLGENEWPFRKGIPLGPKRNWDSMSTRSTPRRFAPF